MAARGQWKIGKSSAPVADVYIRDAAGTFGHNQVRCSRPRCRNLASACAAGVCWTCQAKRHEAQR